MFNDKCRDDETKWRKSKQSEFTLQKCVVLKGKKEAKMCGKLEGKSKYISEAKKTWKKSIRQSVAFTEGVNEHFSVKLDDIYLNRTEHF